MEQNLTSSPAIGNTTVGGSYIVAKFEKQTERLVGFLSKGKRRWLPALSKHEKFISDKIGAEKQLLLITSKYDWQKELHNYYYKLMKLGGQ